MNDHSAPGLDVDSAGPIPLEEEMGRVFGKVAVIGAGVMGSGIAAHLANAGIPCLLLDIVPREVTPEEEKRGLTLESPEVRNRLALRGSGRLASNRRRDIRLDLLIRPFDAEVAHRIKR